MSKTFRTHVVGGRGGNGRSKEYCPKCFYSHYTVIGISLLNTEERRKDGRKKYKRQVHRKCDGCFHEWTVTSSSEYQDFKNNQQTLL